MNDQLQQFARDEIKAGLAKLPEGSRNVFKRLYGGHPDRSLKEILALDINDVVNKMPPGRLDWAMEQVRRSIEKRTAVQQE